MTSEPKSAGRPRTSSRFLGRLVCASVVVVAVAFIGLVIGHTAAGQLIAPHSYDSLHTQIIFRGGRPYAKDTVIAGSHHTVSIRPIPLAKQSHVRAGGSVTANHARVPAVLSNWPEMAKPIGLIGVIALAVAGIDRLGRRVTRARRSRPTLVG